MKLSVSNSIGYGAECMVVLHLCSLPLELCSCKQSHTRALKGSYCLLACSLRHIHDGKTQEMGEGGASADSWSLGICLSHWHYRCFFPMSMGGHLWSPSKWCPNQPLFSGMCDNANNLGEGRPPISEMTRGSSNPKCPKSSSPIETRDTLA